MGVGGQCHALAALLPGKTRYPLYSRLIWDPGPVWMSAENSSPPGFDPRTMQPVVSCCTDYTTPGYSVQI